MAETLTEVQPQEAMTGSQAENILNTYGINPQDVLSAANIDQTLTRPTAAPDDLLGIRSQHQFDTGYAKTKSQLDAIKKGVLDYNASTERGILSIGDWRERAEAIVGEQSSYNQQRNLGLKNLLLEQDRLTGLLGEQGQEVQWRTAVSEKNIDFVRNLKLQYPGAKIGYADSMNDIEKKLVKFEKEQKKKAQKEAYREALLAMGKSVKGLSRRELERKLKKANKAEYERTKKVGDLQLEQLQLTIQKARKALADTSSDVASLFPDSGGVVSGGQSSVESGYSGPMYGNYGIN